MRLYDYDDKFQIESLSLPLSPSPSLSIYSIYLSRAVCGVFVQRN